MAKRELTNKKLFRKAKNYLVGGVDSPVRSFKYVGEDPILIQRGKGSRVYDYAGKRYIDYVLSWGSLILGHAHPEVIKDIANIVSSGLSFGTTHKSEIELAQVLQGAIPQIEKIRFVNSGTEAVMSSVRLARGYTARPKIIKFANFYHGHADYLLVKSGSGLATLGIPLSKGVPKEFIEHTLVVPYADYAAIEKLFKKYGFQIAAVLVEPVGANFGVIEPDIDFLKFIREITKRYKALLIFDEVITGFRFHFGIAAQILGIEPDLIVLGKIIGGGLPIGAYGGSNKIMRNLSPLGRVYQASTFAGNPVVMQAGLATLKILSGLKDEYKRLEILTEYLARSLENEAKVYSLALKIDKFGSLFSFNFKEKRHFKVFYKQILRKGIYFAPSEFEANFLSFAHTKKDIEETILKAKELIRTL